MQVRPAKNNDRADPTYLKSVCSGIEIGMSDSPRRYGRHRAVFMLPDCFSLLVFSLSADKLVIVRLFEQLNDIFRIPALFQESTKGLVAQLA